jgi:hypothetical protein
MVYATLAVVIALLLVVIGWQHREIAQRDVKLTALWGAAMEAMPYPKRSILADFMQRGMITRNAVQNAAMLLQESHERMDLYARLLKHIVNCAKDVQSWEQSHPAPPLSPLPVGAPTRGRAA